MNQEFEKFLLEVTNATGCEQKDVIQSLWSGYGKIARFKLLGSKLETVVVKHIALNQSGSHPRGWNTDLSHQRKIKSYQVETHWYKEWNDQCYGFSRTAKFLGAYAKEDEQWIVLEDLDAEFPVRKQQLKLDEIKTCLRWLANFHARFLNRKPEGLWEVGTYWHLDTRPEEFEKIEHKQLKSKAHRIDEILKECEFQTIVHGDAKLANFCFSEHGEGVAAVDFQYVGRGCGMKDVTYFLGSCLTSKDCEIYAEELLEHYFEELGRAVAMNNHDILFEQLEKEWRSMYPVVWTDFTRFMLGWMPTHQKVNGYSEKLMNSVLKDLK